MSIVFEEGMYRVNVALCERMGYSFPQAISRLCRRGCVPGSEKRGGRWWVPESFVAGRGEIVRGRHVARA
jgi:hypothetical protein